MKKNHIMGKIILILLMLFMLIQYLNLNSIISLKINNPNLNLKYNTLEINNFNNFELIQDSEYVESNLTSSELSFIYEGTTSEWVTERYIYTFNSYGNCSDITIQVNIEFSLADTNDHINVGLLVGSYYDSSGDYIGIPPYYGSHIQSVTHVYDAWDASQTTYLTSLFGYGETEEYFAGANVAGLSGNVTAYQQRINGKLICSLKDVNYSTNYLTHTWINRDHAINYIILYINSRQIYSNVSATFTSMSGVLTFEKEITPTIIFPGYTTIVFFSGISIITILGVFRKRIKNNHINLA